MGRGGGAASPSEALCGAHSSAHTESLHSSGPSTPCGLAAWPELMSKSNLRRQRQGRGHAASSVDPALHSSGRFLNELVSYRQTSEAKESPV